MSTLINYLSYPIKKLFNTPEFKWAVRKLGFNPVSNVSYPFMWYPEAVLTKHGPKFKYADGVEMTSYHIRGIWALNDNGNGFEAYLCSVKFPSGLPFIMPGSVTGMFQTIASNGLGQNDDIITTPFANGALVSLNGINVPVSSLDINLYTYGNNPQEDGSFIYSLIIDATVENPNNEQITGLIAYDFEFLLPTGDADPIIFQD